MSHRLLPLYQLSIKQCADRQIVLLAMMYNSVSWAVLTPGGQAFPLAEPHFGRCHITLLGDLGGGRASGTRTGGRTHRQVVSKTWSSVASIGTWSSVNNTRSPVAS